MVGTTSKNTHKKITSKSKTTKSDKLTKKLVWFGIVLITLPVLVGFAASALTRDIMNSFGNLNQPPFAPPAWLFPVAWTILYILMGIASFLIYKQIPTTKQGKSLRKASLILYSIQLFFNFWWTIFFFRFELRYFAFGWLLAMWAMILTLIILCFRNHTKAAAFCLLPYLLWCTFAAVLNISVAILN